MEEKIIESSKGKKVLNFVIKTMNGMAYGLFSTLIIGTILSTIASFFKVDSYLYNNLSAIADFLKKSTGIGIGLGIAWGLKLEGLKLLSVAMAGGICTWMCNPIGIKVGDPLVVYIVVICVALLSNLTLKKKTPIDIIIIPLFVILLAGIITLIISTPISYVTKGLTRLISICTKAQPFIMGIVISVLMGMALTAPISSAAIAAIVFNVASVNGDLTTSLVLAGGASAIGCSVQMVGFAIMSRKDNNIGMIISVGIGTSMLQFKNILKKPILWVPTIIVSAILGPIGTCLIKTKCASADAGMGTSGLVGLIGTYNQMGNSWQTWISLIVLMVIAPMILVYIIDIIFRKYGLIKEGDLKI